MPPWTGSFNRSGSPILRIGIGGVIPQSKQEFDALIDTGFTGFLSMPLTRAFPLGLVLYGTTSVVLADGSTSYRLTAFGIAEVAGERKAGVIILEGGSDQVLLGMEFLTRFRKALSVKPVSNLVEMSDDAPPSGPPALGPPAPGPGPTKA